MIAEAWNAVEADRNGHPLIKLKMFNTEAWGKRAYRPLGSLLMKLVATL